MSVRIRCSFRSDVLFTTAYRRPYAGCAQSIPGRKAAQPAGLVLISRVTLSTARDNDFINFSTDYNDPIAIYRSERPRSNPSAFVRRYYEPVSELSDQFDRPLRQPVAIKCHVAGQRRCRGGIFQTDITGDGTGDGSSVSNGGAGDLLPGTNVGDFGRALASMGSIRGSQTLTTQWSDKLRRPAKC